MSIARCLKSAPAALGKRWFAAAAPERVDPMTVFDNIDTNGDGVLSRDEFKIAMDHIGYEQLVEVSKAVSRMELSSKSSEETSSLMKRMTTTFDVTVSKIMPAGFGWQLFSGFAEDAGFASTDIGFYLLTGLGDGLFVAAGHTLYCAIQNAALKKGHNIKDQAQTGIFLGSAAVCSGGMWQPTVDVLTNAGGSFTQVLLGTATMTTAYFYIGLRAGRLVYSNVMPAIEGPSYGNLKGDAALSVSIGGAGGCFVGTDVSFAAGNWLRPLLGIEETTARLMGCALAGSSTGTGFLVTQSAQNLLVPAGKNWVD